MPAQMPASLSAQVVIETIRKAISPFVGDTMARASTDTLGRKVGFEGHLVSGAQALALVEKVSQGLNVFVGREKAEQVQQEILRLLAADGGVR
jgi:hypothetical protein